MLGCNLDTDYFHPSVRDEQGRRLYLYARPHGRRDRDTVDEVAFGARRLGLLNGIREGLDVGYQLIGAERRLPDPGLDDTSFLDTKFNGATLGALDRTRHIHRDGADL